MFVIDETLSGHTIDLLDRYFAYFPSKDCFGTFGIVFKVAEDEFATLMEEALKTGVPINPDLLYDPLPPEFVEAMDNGTAAI